MRGKAREERNQVRPRGGSMYLDEGRLIRAGAGAIHQDRDVWASTDAVGKDCKAAAGALAVLERGSVRTDAGAIDQRRDIRADADAGAANALVASGVAVAVVARS